MACRPCARAISARWPSWGSADPADRRVQQQPEYREGRQGAAAWRHSVPGALFSSKSKTVQRRERLFLIRPRLVSINGVTVAAPANIVTVANPSFGDAVAAPWDEKPAASAAQFERIQGGSGLRAVDGRRAVIRDPQSGGVAPSWPAAPASGAAPLAIPVPQAQDPQLLNPLRDGGAIPPRGHPGRPPASRDSSGRIGTRPGIAARDDRVAGAPQPLQKGSTAPCAMRCRRAGP